MNIITLSDINCTYHPYIMNRYTIYSLSDASLTYSIKSLVRISIEQLLKDKNL